MDVTLIYSTFFTPVTEIYMVMIHAKRVIYMSHMEGLTLDRTARKYMEQICGTQFQKMLKYQSLKQCQSFKQRLRNFFQEETSSIRVGRRHDGCSKTTNWWQQSNRRDSVPTSVLKNKQ